MTTIKHWDQHHKGFEQTLRKQVQALVEQALQRQWEQEVTALIGRDPHARRERSGQRKTQAVCQRCGSRRTREFARNGHRRRQLVTTYGVVTTWLPRLRCQCGGSVRIPFSLLAPYQRFWHDLEAQLVRWAHLGLSLRQMQRELGDQLQTQVGLRRLNQAVQAVRKPPVTVLKDVPPVILLDALWLTLLEPTGQVHWDARGRRRPHKRGHKVPVLVALGVWPSSSRWQVLDWQLAQAESRDAWEPLLVDLEQRGVYRERGLQLLIHDGGQGLVAALEWVYPHLPHQRCLFHKLRNLRAAFQAQASQPDARRQARQSLLQEAAAIFRAPTAAQALRLRAAFCQRWQANQPKVVATLCRDWDETIAFYGVRARFPDWPTQALRTTSLLERVNRMLRRLVRAAGAFHSRAGLSAAVARVLMPLRAT